MQNNSFNLNVRKTVFVELSRVWHVIENHKQYQCPCDFTVDEKLCPVEMYDTYWVKMTRNECTVYSRGHVLNGTTVWLFGFTPV